uniref:DNA-directed RNA polymerase subunit beta n=1 Tax=Lygus hesperus TaxID=30085 RepID=A0A0A9XUC0_LYGHE
MGDVDNHSDPINQWVKQDADDDIYKAILRRVIKKRRHWKGKLEGISSVLTNNMDDMMVFKMEFTYVKSKTGEPLHCSTTFSGVNGKVFLGKMECETPPSKIKRRSMGVKWSQEDPADPNWVLPLTIATNIERSDATLRAIKQIGVKVTDQKTMYKVNFEMERNRGHKKVGCYSWFEMIKNGVLRPIYVKTLTCEDDGGKMPQPKTQLKPNITEEGIAKIIVFDTPQQAAYLFPQVSEDKETQDEPKDPEDPYQER